MGKTWRKTTGDEDEHKRKPKKKDRKKTKEKLKKLTS